MLARARRRTARGRAARAADRRSPRVVGTLLADAASDPALRRAGARRRRTSPTSPALAATIDVDGIVAAREFVVRELARALRGRVRALPTRRCAVARRPTRRRRRRSAPRRLANLCLRYLVRARRRAGARAGGRAVRRRRQHDRRDRGARRASTDSDAAGAGRAVRALRGALARRAAGARQVVRAAGDVACAPDTLAARAVAARAPAVQRPQPEPRALAGRRVRAAQLRAASTPRDGAGYAFVADQVLALDRGQPAARGDARRRVQPVAALRRAATRALQRAALRANRRLRAPSPDVRRDRRRNSTDRAPLRGASRDSPVRLDGDVPRLAPAVPAHAARREHAPACPRPSPDCRTASRARCRRSAARPARASSRPSAIARGNAPAQRAGMRFAAHHRHVA